MPYTYKKEGDKYVVYKKGSGKRVGATKGTKTALKKYLAALHIHGESIQHNLKFKNMKSNKPIKLASLLEGTDPVEKMTTEQKKAFLEAVYRFAEHANSIYRQHSLNETAQYLGELIEAASQLTLAETQDWFDGMTVNRHMKHLSEAFKIFEKTANEMSTLQQRLEASYEDIGETLSKYYDVGSMVNEASGENYQQFFQKAMKKFKIEEPSDLESPRQKKKFFNWVDTNYTAKAEKGKEGEKK